MNNADLTPDTNKQQPSVLHLAETLQFINPIKGLLYVGAGDGSAVTDRFQNWNISNALLIEANPEYQETLTNHVNQIPGWMAVSCLLGETDGEMDYFQASNPYESGTITPQVLQPIWPNLSENSRIKLQQSSLSMLLKKSAYSQTASKINWAIIDCLPALPILKGASNYIEQWDVVLLRTILDQSLDIIAGSKLNEIDEYMLPLGYRRLAITDSYHPAIGEVLYSKDWKQCLYPKLNELKQTNNEHVQIAKELQTQLQQLTKERDEQGKLATEREAQIQQLTQVRDEQSQLVKERDAQLQQLTKERDEQGKLATEREAQIQQLTQVRDEATDKANANDNRINELEQQLADQDHRQHLLDDEFVKAEAQIELIKDILIREKAF